MKSNETTPLPQLDEKGSALPYLLGWMMGVPLSLLLLIAMFRTVF